MSAKYHALASATASIARRKAPKEARSWSRALPSLEVSSRFDYQIHTGHPMRIGNRIRDCGRDFAGGDPDLDEAEE